TFVTFETVFVSTPMTYNFVPNPFVPNARTYVTSALASIKYRDSFRTSGYWAHGHVARFVAVLEFILSQEVLAELLATVLRSAQQGLLKIAKKDNIPAISVWSWMNKNSPIWA